MKELPTFVKPYKKTPTFTRDTVPAGLLKSHTTKKGTWGKICIIKGKLRYVIESEPIETTELTPQKFGVVEPEVPHHLEIDSEVKFFVEFHK